MRYLSIEAVPPAESSKLEAFYGLLRKALRDAKDHQQTEEYLSHLETDERNADRRGLRTNFSSMPNGSLLRGKRFLCDRNGNCVKRAHWKPKLGAPFKTYLEISKSTNDKEKSITPNASFKRNRNTITGQNYNRGKELNRLYVSNAYFPEINKLLGKKKISKKQFHGSLRRIKRSLNAFQKVSSETTTKTQETTNSKDFDLFKEQQIRQYCLTHKCGIKTDEIQDRQAPEHEKSVSEPSDRAVFLKILKQIRGSEKKGMTAVNLNSENNIARHAQIKRANPFCPPWGCRRRRNEILTAKPSLKDISREKILKSILSVANRKKGVNVRDKVSETVRHRNYSFDRNLRLSPFCPHRGCRG